MNKFTLRKILLSIAIIGSVISPFTLKPVFKGFGGYEEVITAQGVIDNKRSVPYECGTIKDKRTCTDYLLSVNGVEKGVQNYTFQGYSVGQKITLVTTQSKRQSYLWEEVLIIWSVISLGILACVTLPPFFMWLYWLLGSNSKKSFKEWLNS